MKAKNNDIFSYESLGFYFPSHLANENSKLKPFVEIRNHYIKKGNKWVLTKSTYGAITAREYALGCSKDNVRFFNMLGYAKRELGMSMEFRTRICDKFYSISPDGTEKSESLYFTKSSWDIVDEAYIRKYNSKPKH